MARLPLAALLAATLTASAYWPGLMPWDPVHQYEEALSGRITDWHPPTMQWLWRQALPLASGPSPMLVLQLLLYWGGLALLAIAMRRSGGPRLGWSMLGCGFLPIGVALSGTILKDSLMAGALLVAFGFYACQLDRPRAALKIGAAAMLIFAATLRFNAFTACLPLLISLAPARWRRPPAHLVATGLAAAIVLVAAMPVANRLIGARRSDVTLSLIIFDLGGITKQAGVDAFPATLKVDAPVRVNAACYRADKWDSYSDWVDPECPLGYTAWKASVPHDVSPYRLWIRAILAHPFAYAAHRLHHFALNTRLLPLSDSVERPVPIAAPNPWGIAAPANRLFAVIDRAARIVAHTPLGWPIVWIAVALGALIAGSAAPGRRLIVPLAASASLYGLGYAVFSVASELRYHLWTMLAALIAGAMISAQWHTITRRRLLLAAAPVAAAVLAAIALRV